MKYSYNWLQTHIEEKLPDVKILKETIIFHAFEVESIEKKNGLPDRAGDFIFDIKVLPDRAGDCLSHYGMAREIAGLLKLTLKPQLKASLPDIPLALPVEVKSDTCIRYIAIQINGITVGPSPAWLRDRLESVGQRSINNIVDTTNFILLDTGQPTHAYDAAKIDGGIIVRTAHDGETIITLTDETKTLTPDVIVVADYVGAIAIAGVKGGKTAEITVIVDSENKDSAGPRVSSPDTTESLFSSPTTSVILEIANFDAASVRRTARTLGLLSDAAKRFENNLSPVGALGAAAQLVALIIDSAGGTIVGVTDYYPAPIAERTISFSLSDIRRLLGTSIDTYAIEDVFDQYHYIYTKDDDSFVLTVPYWRADITGVHDIAEEVGRVLGYDTIPAHSLPFVPTTVKNETYEKIRSVKAWLVAHGYSEIITYAFQKKGEVYIYGAPKDRSALRTNLSEGMKESYELNQSHAPLLGTSDIKLFEIGTVFLKEEEETHVASVDKGMIEELTLDAYIAMHNVDLTTQLPLSVFGSVQAFKQWSVYPSSTRDIAVWVNNDTDNILLESILTTYAQEYCVRPPVCFDEFSKDGKTSLAYHLVYQAADRTLTEHEIEGWYAVLTERIVAAGVFSIR